MSMTNCPNCGAPSDGSGYCAYCETRYDRASKKQDIEPSFAPHIFQLNGVGVRVVDVSMSALAYDKEDLSRIKALELKQMAEKIAEQLLEQKLIKRITRVYPYPMECADVVTSRMTLYVVDPEEVDNARRTRTFISQ